MKPKNGKTKISLYINVPKHKTIKPTSSSQLNVSQPIAKLAIQTKPGLETPITFLAKDDINLVIAIYNTLKKSNPKIPKKIIIINIG